MIRIYAKDSGQTIGNISEDDLQTLVNYMEEESSTDQDYYLAAATIGALAESGASSDLLSVLRSAIGQSDGVDIVWERLGA